jgi:glycerol-3-phosphate dehydrogenase
MPASTLGAPAAIAGAMRADDIRDLLVIGGGINGAAVARDAAGRGLSVILVEAGDLASGTSSASTRLIHGGLRYLEFGELGLVRKALKEREIILAAAPHLSWPMPFLLPIVPGGRPAWQLRAGLFLYDRLARRRAFPPAARVALREQPAAAAFRRDLVSAFRFWDGWTDDARLVVLNARDASARGAEILLRDPVVAARNVEGHWEVTLASGRVRAARTLVNCAGPWAEQVARDLLTVPNPPRLRLVQGAHLVTRRVNRGADAWMLQQRDGRIVFVIPYEQEFSLIGTTETPVDTPGGVGCTEAEARYLLDAANDVLAKPLGPADIAHRFAGVRPLVLEEGKGERETTRDWKLVRHDSNTLTVIGGKLTTYRLLAEDVLRAIAPRSARWTADAPLPGGNMPRQKGSTPDQDFERWLAALVAANPDYDPEIVRRLGRLWGTEAEAMLAGGLGASLGGLFEAELVHMMDREWAREPDDVLWRRTRLGLHLDAETQARIAVAMGGRVSA